LALAFRANIEKIPTSHPNFKQPLIHPPSNKVFICTQNHRFTLTHKNLKQNPLPLSFKNLHHPTLHPLLHQQYPLATYQFHPQQINNA
ncbi:glutamine amidotransferase-related protein, partial [Siminovitchia fortis]